LQQRLQARGERAGSDAVRAVLERDQRVFQRADAPVLDAVLRRQGPKAGTLARARAAAWEDSYAAGPAVTGDERTDRPSCLTHRVANESPARGEPACASRLEPAIQDATARDRPARGAVIPAVA